MFLILFCLFVTIENWAMRQRTNAHKFVICNFNTQNHLKMAKICILRPKNVTFIQSYNPGPLQHTFMTPSLCVLRPRNVKSNFQKYFEIFIFGGFGRFWVTLNHSAPLGWYFHHYFPFHFFFPFSVATFSHRRSARIKKLISRKLLKMATLLYWSDLRFLIWGV